MVVRRQGDEIARDGAGRGPVLERPLRVGPALRPGDDADVLAAHAGDVVHGVGDVLGVDLGIAK